MPIVSGYCQSYKKELLRATHDFSADIIKAALYTSVADLRPEATTAYSATNEATGVNWPAGGMPLSLIAPYPDIDPRTGNGVVQYAALLVSNVTITFRAVLLYNSSKANRAISILDRGIDVVLTSGPLLLQSTPTNPFLIVLA